MTSSSSPTPPASPPPTVASGDLLARLREDLRQAGYTVEGMGEVLGPVASAALHREQPLPATRVTDRAAGGAAATLLRCFVLGLPVGSFDLEVALPRTGVGGLLSLGLVLEIPSSGFQGLSRGAGYPESWPLPLLTGGGW